jgi:hypothetical protein
MIIRALKTKQDKFLYCVWAFNKNYELRPDVNHVNYDQPETDSDEENYN